MPQPDLLIDDRNWPPPYAAGAKQKPKKQKKQPKKAPKKK
jgi:hypothetical protein